MEIFVLACCGSVVLPVVTSVFVFIGLLFEEMGDARNQGRAKRKAKHKQKKAKEQQKKEQIQLQKELVQEFKKQYNQPTTWRYK